MKALITLFAILMLALGSCTETILEEIIKVDTVFVSKPQTVAPTFITVRDTIVVRDTISTTVVIRDTIVNNVVVHDTIFQVVVKDSIIVKQVEKVVNHYDTIIQLVYDTIINNIHTTDTVFKTIVQHDTVTLMTEVNRVIYLDTLYIPIFNRVINSIPTEIMPYIQEFYQLAGQHGHLVQGGPMLVVYVHESDLPGEGWNSNSYWIGGNYGNMYLELNEELSTEQQRASVFRELSRLQLKRKYTNVPDRIMNPLFPPDTEITNNHLNVLFANPQPI